VGTDFYENPEVVASSTKWPRTIVALDMLRGLRVQRALDVGCGNGEVSAALAELLGGTVVCSDISSVAVEQCRARGLEAHQVELGGARLPFQDGSFDLVFMTEVLEHLLYPDRALVEIHRTLRPGGYLLLSTPNLACLPNRVLLPLGWQPLFSEVSEDRVLGRRLSAFGQGNPTVGHLRLYTRRGLEEMLEMHGYRILSLRGAGFHPHGVLSKIEKVTAVVPGLAMVFVALTQKTGDAAVTVQLAANHYGLSQPCPIDDAGG
jgi:SAM-dependent methyltransferase